MEEDKNLENAKDIENLRLLYQENAKIVAIFWEWRNKIITYLFTAIGALFVLAGWLYQQNFGPWVSAPFLLGALLSMFSLRLEQRNAEILKNCYLVGKSLEDELNPGKSASFNSIDKAHSNNKGFFKGVTYTQTLFYTYLGVAILLLVVSALIYCKPVYPPPSAKS